MKKGLLLWLFVAMSVLHTFAQTRTITGKVTDTKDGSPLPGVSVIVKGTTKGTVTGADGSYKIDAGSNDALIFSFIGYVNQEKPVGGAANISVSLGTDNKQLNEVVVTALGIAKEKKALGYSVQKLGPDELVNSNEHNVIEALASKAAGVQVIGSGGTPGASSKIIIRGNSTFSGNNQPLIVVDGVPIDNSTNATVARNYAYNSNLGGVNNSNRALDINPDDIASVTILKGPAAAALYGANAASGAIIYTTKRGKAGATRVTYSFNAGFDKVNKTPDEQFKYGQGNWRGGVPTTDLTTPYSWGPAITGQVYHNTDKFFKTGNNFTHDVAVTGGNENTSFRLSLNRVDQKGIVPTTDLQKTSVRINADSKISNRLTMGISANYVLTEGTKAQNGSNVSGVMLALMRAPVSYNLADWHNSDGSSKNYYSGYDNPYWGLYNNPYKDKTDRFLGNVNTSFKITDWLSLNNRTGVDMYTQYSKQIFAIGSVSVSDKQGQIEENTLVSRNLYSDLILTGHKTFAEKFEVTGNLGGNVNQQQYNNQYSKGNQLTIPGYYNMNNASTLYADEAITTKRTSALYYDLEFAYKNQFFLTTTGRNEWSSTFGAAKNNFFYPSVSGSWIFTEILPVSNVLTYGKLRAAIAGGGKSPDPYTANTVYTSPQFADGFTDGNYFPFLGQNGFSLSNTLGNKNLKPERTVEKEIGLDVKLFSKVNLEVTYYDKQSKDILVARPVAGSSGFQGIVSNAGRMQNKGVEVLASADVFKSKDFTWNIQVNWSMNKNKVLELAEGVTENSVESAFTQIGSYAIVGQPYGALWGSKWQRHDGKIIVDDSGSPLVDPTSGNLGNPFPDWTGGARTTFTYKNLTLSALLDVRHGGKIWNGTYARMNNLGRTKESQDREKTFIIPGVVEGTDGKFTDNTTPVDAQTYFRYYKGDFSGAAAENAVQDGGWVRLREVSLAYHYNFANSNVFKFAELTVTGRNLWLHTKYKGVDPETSLTGAGSNLTGFDYFNNPGTKTYAIGLRVGF